MKATPLLVTAIAFLMVAANVASGDSFGTGANQFTIDFVNISGDARSANGTSIGTGRTFNDPSNGFRIGVHEIANEQWNKFISIYGTPTGSPSSSYDEDSDWTGTNVPTNEVSWFEAAQFVNWLNTSTGHQAAYKFTGTQGTSDYTFATWEPDDAGYDADNPYRHSDTFYFLPTEDEWVKAAYWNGTMLQEYATKEGDSLIQGDGVSGAGWNYYEDGYATDPAGPWAVGSGSEELNGTFDMMGNVIEWMESPYNSGDYLFDSYRVVRGGSYYNYDRLLKLSYRYGNYPDVENGMVGFRVASIPEPATLLLLGLGGLMLGKRR